MVYEDNDCGYYDYLKYQEYSGGCFIVSITFTLGNLKEFYDDYVMETQVTLMSAYACGFQTTRYSIEIYMKKPIIKIRRTHMEKFYIVSNNSMLGGKYLEYLESVNKITDLFRGFAARNNIHTNSFHPTVTRLWIDPDAEDIKNFSTGFMADTLGKFKLRNPLNKEWVSLCKENGLTENARKPYVP